MTTKPESLPVIFRRDRGKDGDVTAVFPTLPYSVNGLYWTCYARMGQHSSCGVDWYYSTRPATPDEYAPLLRELQGIYERSMAPGDPVYKLVPCLKMTPAHRKAFDAQVAQWREERN
jgi:hypothetical protein